MIVIADSTPLHYLILIHQTDLLPRLFDRILIPPAVFEELQHQIPVCHDHRFPRPMFETAPQLVADRLQIYQERAGHVLQRTWSQLP